MAAQMMAARLVILLLTVFLQGCSIFMTTGISAGSGDLQVDGMSQHESIPYASQGLEAGFYLQPVHAVPVAIGARGTVDSVEKLDTDTHWQPQWKRTTVHPHLMVWTPGESKRFYLVIGERKSDFRGAKDPDAFSRGYESVKGLEVGLGLQLPRESPAFGRFHTRLRYAWYFEVFSNQLQGDIEREGQKSGDKKQQEIGLKAGISVFVNGAYIFTGRDIIELDSTWSTSKFR